MPVSTATHEPAGLPHAGKPRVPRRAGRFLALAVVGVGLLALFYAFAVEPYSVEVVQVEVPLRGLPSTLDGLTIVHLSDPHLHLRPGVANLARAVEIAREVNPDLVLLTGDFVSSRPADLDRGLEALSSLRARYGVFAVLGNHDVRTDSAWVAADLSRSGIRVLRDEGVPLEIHGTRLWLLGVEDTGYVSRSLDPLRATWQRKVETFAALLAGIPEDELRLLLVHNPDFSEILPEGRVDLVLAGHTHGGQVRLPLLGALWIPSAFGQRFAGGLVKGERTTVYVTRGLGTITLPVRFLCRPEITVLRLRAG